VVALAFCLLGCAREPESSVPLLAERDHHLEAHDATIRELNADYDATHEAFRIAFRDFNARRTERQLLGSPGTSSLLAAFEQAEASIEEQIKDPVRKAGLLALTDRAEHTARAALAQREKVTVLERRRAGTEVHQDRMIRFRFELNGRMSREEWVRAFPPAQAPARESK
jgi:hypothetical protein